MAESQKPPPPEDSLPLPPQLNIYERVHLVMAECETLVKKKFIEVGRGGYKVITFDQVTEVVQPLLVKHGILVIPSVIEWDHVEPAEVYDINKKKNPGRTQATVRVRWQNIENPEDYFEADWFGFGVDGGDKGPGKATTYAIRNAIMRTLQIITGEGAGNNTPPKTQGAKGAGKNGSSSKPPPGKADSATGEKITTDQANTLLDTMQDNQCPRNKVNGWMKEYKAGYFHDLTVPQYDDLLHKITNGKSGRLLYKG